MRRALGVTAIELLITVSLVGVLTAVGAQFFVTQLRASELQKAVNETSENARTALSLITWDLQNAGYRVSVSNSNPAITAVADGYRDAVSVRFLDESLDPAPAQVKRVSYRSNLSNGTYSLLRTEESFRSDGTLESTNAQSTVLDIVALNFRYETRANQFLTPTGTSCPSGSTPVPGAGGGTVNCSVNWVEQDQPLRLVRTIKVQLLARSSAQVPNYRDTKDYSTLFSGTGSYVTEPGYVYHFAEQTVVAGNLSR
jgi:Tfp pilus assembly protein PilW